MRHAVTVSLVLALGNFVCGQALNPKSVKLSMGMDPQLDVQLQSLVAEGPRVEKWRIKSDDLARAEERLKFSLVKKFAPDYATLDWLGSDVDVNDTQPVRAMWKVGGLVLQCADLERPYSTIGTVGGQLGTDLLDDQATCKAIGEWVARVLDVSVTPDKLLTVMRGKRDDEALGHVRWGFVSVQDDLASSAQNDPKRVWSAGMVWWTDGCDIVIGKSWMTADLIKEMNASSRTTSAGERHTRFQRGD